MARASGESGSQEARRRVEYAEAGAAQRQSFLFRWRKAIASAESPLTSTERLAAWTLSAHMDADGGSCWPSVKRLAQESDLGESTVRRALTGVCEKGYLDRPKRGGGREGDTAHYEARLPEPLAPSTSEPLGASTSEPLAPPEPLAPSTRTARSEHQGRQEDVKENDVVAGGYAFEALIAQLGKLTQKQVASARGCYEADREAFERAVAYAQANGKNAVALLSTLINTGEWRSIKPSKAERTRKASRQRMAEIAAIEAERHR